MMTEIKQAAVETCRLGVLCGEKKIMGFFGEIISNEPVEIPIPNGYILKLLIACLPDHESSSILFVRTQNEENGFALCNLTKKGPLQSSLRHEFGPEDSPIVLWTAGNNIHLTGNWIWDEDEVSDLESDDECAEEVDGNIQGRVNEDLHADSMSKGKRRENHGVDNIPSKKKQKKVASQPSAPSEAIIPSEQLVVISKPPSDINSRPIWKIKPINGEGTLIPSPKQKAQSGVLVSDYVIGHGTEPKLGSTVCITYEGLFPNGTKFDANLKRSKPLKFRKGSGQVFKILGISSKYY